MKQVESFGNKFTMRALVFLCSVLIMQGVQGWWTTEDFLQTTTMDYTGINCDGYLYNNNGTFQSPNYPSNYPNNAKCTWYIRPSLSGHSIRLELVNLRAECSFDWVFIYDGYDTNSRRVSQLCSANSFVYHSTGRYLTIHFSSDSSVTRQGFLASYKVVAQGSCKYNCGYQVGNCSCQYDCEYRGTCCADYATICGSYNTTSYPYPTTSQPSCRYNCGYNMGSCSCSSSCQWNGNCCHDYYSYCGSSTSYPEPTSSQPSCRYNCGYNMGSCSCSSSCQWNGNCCHDYYSHCGSSPTTTYPTSSQPSCRYNCGYNMGSCSCSSSCQWNGNCCHDYYSHCGYIYTTTYPATSQPSCRYNCGYNMGSCSCSSSCQWNGNCCHDYYSYCGSSSTTSYPEPTSSQPSCRYNCGYNMGSCSCSSSCQWNGNCCHDYYSHCGSSPTTIYPEPTSSQPSCRYNCGYNMGSCSCSSSCQWNGNCCHDYYSYCGTSTEVPTTGPCGGSLFGSGTISSPNHPDYYNDNSYCVWQLRAAYDQRIFLAFSYLQLENCCNCDYISIYDGPYTYSPYLGKVCNNTLSTFYSSSNYMTVIFRTDGSVVGRGFRAEFMSSLKPSSGRVDCSSDNMNIVINRAYLNSLGYDGHSLYLDDENCKPQISSYEVTFSFPLYACGTVKHFNSGRVVYTNNIRGFPSSQGEIVRQSYLKMNVNCTMEEDSMSQIMFVVGNGGNSSIAGSGHYNTSMAFYTSSSFSYKVTNVPYQVALNQDLYVQVDLSRHDSNLVLFLDTCVAAPSPFDFETRPYYLVRNGCTVDSTYRPISSGSWYRARFTFKAFMFLRGTESVYLQCKVLICPSSESNSRCRRGCSRRRARELEPKHESQTLVMGPIQLKKAEEEKKEPEEQNEA